jgi:glutathione S-transferase
MDTPLLWHIPLSHFSEKVRWTLDYKGIAHRRRVLGADYLIRAWRATGRGTLPILFLDGRPIGDSTRIIEALEERYPEPPLYPRDAEARRQEPVVDLPRHRKAVEHGRRKEQPRVVRDAIGRRVDGPFHSADNAIAVLINSRHFGERPASFELAVKNLQRRLFDAYASGSPAKHRGTKA